MARSGKKIFRYILEVLILAALLWIGFIVGGRALCHIAIGQIAELTGTKIKAESINFSTSGSVFIKNLVISPYKKQNGDDFILKAESVWGRFRLGSLLLLRPRLKVVSVNDFVFNARYDLDTGLWNLSALKIKMPQGGGSGKMPLIILGGGTLQYSKISNGQVKVAAEAPLAARFGFDRETQDGYGFEISTAKMASGYGKSRLTGTWKPGSITFAGGVSSTDIPALETAWAIDHLAAELKYDRNRTFSLKLRIKDLQTNPRSLLRKEAAGASLDRFALVGPSFLEKSGPFTALQKFFSRYQPWGQADLDFDASGNLNRPGESSLSGKVCCKDVAICYYRFPYSVEHLTGQVDFTNDSVTFNNLAGKHGNTELILNGWTRDFGPELKYKIRITSDNMALDNDLYDALSVKQKELWPVFSPRGLAAIDYRISWLSQTDKKETLAVKLIGAEALYRHFPYPLKNLEGSLFFDGSTIVVSDVVSQVNLQKITLNGKVVTRSDDKPIYDILIDVNNMPLDSTLKQALPDREKQLCGQFDLAGLVDGRINVSTPIDDIGEQNPGPANYTADLFFKDASLRSNKFPALISDVSAHAVFTPDLINVKNLTGRYNQGSISLTGRIQPDQQFCYNLSVNIRQTQLNDDLFALLPQSLKKIVSEVQPDGKVNLIAELNNADGMAHPAYRVTVDCLGDSVNFKRFPYPLKDVTGILSITNDTIKLQDITATPAPLAFLRKQEGGANTSAIKLNGQISLADNAFDKAVFQLSAKDIFFDEQLGIALPQAIHPFYRNLSPTGCFDLDLENISIFNADDGEKYIDLTGAARFKGCSFNVSAARAELYAELRAKALYKTGVGLCNGQANIVADTLRIQNKSLTSLKTDICYDPNLHNWATKNLIADCYGGKLTGRVEFRRPAHATPECMLQVAFDNVDLRQFLSDTKSKQTPDTEHTSGKMGGELGLMVGADEKSSRIGICKLTINDMQVGRLSPLSKLLNVLKLTEPKDFAFDQMLVDSYIKGERLFFRKLDLSGEAIAFQGSGWMNLPSHNVDLVLTARGRRLATADPSVLQSLTEGLGQAVVQMKVTGDLYDPQITTKTFPVIGQSLQILGIPR
jgi:hypothetical protein